MLNKRSKRILNTFCMAFGLFLMGNYSQAALLYNNGNTNNLSANTRCDSGPGVCPDDTWIIYDDFTLAGASTVTGFSYTDWFFTGDPNNYISTSWSIWSSSPLLPGSPIYSGSATATLAGTGLTSTETPEFGPNQYVFNVTGLSLNLLGGTQYWLGTSNVVTDSKITTYAAIGDINGSGNAISSDGTNFFCCKAERDFKINGTSSVPVPVPATLALFGLGLVGLGWSRRRTN